MSDVQFNVGDQVVLKSTGTHMYVKEVLDGACICYWEDEDGKLIADSKFPNELLTHYKEEITGEDAATIG